MSNDDTPTQQFEHKTSAPTPTGAPGPTATPHPRDADAAHATAPSANAASSANAAPPLWSTDDPQHHIVPRQTDDAHTTPRKTGPSTPTLVLASMMLIIGVAALMLSQRFPSSPIAGLWSNPTMTVAIGFAIAGIVLLIVAIAWSIAKGIHILAHRRNDGAETWTTSDRETPSTSRPLDTADMTTFHDDGTAKMKPPANPND